LLSYLTERLSNSILKPSDYVNLINDEKLYNYLQELWNLLVKNWDEKEKTNYKILQSDEVRPYVINCFLENTLKPVLVENINKYPKWIHPGLEDSTGQSITQKIEQLLERINILLQTLNLDYRDWLQIAILWSETIVNKIKLDKNIKDILNSRIIQTQNIIDKKFTCWILENYQSLYSLRLKQPISVCHILDSIARNIVNGKVALIVIDGMALDQYLVLKDSIETQTRKMWL